MTKQERTALAARFKTLANEYLQIVELAQGSETDEVLNYLAETGRLWPMSLDEMAVELLAEADKLEAVANG